LLIVVMAINAITIIRKIFFILISSTSAMMRVLGVYPASFVTQSPAAGSADICPPAGAARSDLAENSPANLFALHAQADRMSALQTYVLRPSRDGWDHEEGYRSTRGRNPDRVASKSPVPT
jgi:hypothetical protein